jgi:hypothetical protein
VRRNRRLKAPPPEEQSRIGLTVLQGDHPLPATRGECQDGRRLCPLVRCRYHLYANIDEHGVGFELVHADQQARDGFFDGIDPENMPATCALDVADQVAESAAEPSLEMVAQLSGISLETVRTDYHKAIEKLAAAFGIDRDELVAALESATPTAAAPEDEETEP